MTHDFTWRLFRGEIIPWAVQWYCRYDVGYRDLEEMLEERGIKVDHTVFKGFVAMGALRKKQAKAFQLQPGIRGEVRLVERAQCQ